MDIHSQLNAQFVQEESVQSWALVVFLLGYSRQRTQAVYEDFVHSGAAIDFLAHTGSGDSQQKAHQADHCH